MKTNDVNTACCKNDFDTLDTITINVEETGEANYKIIYTGKENIPEGYHEIVCAKSLATQLAELIGKEPCVDTDSKEYDPNALEILVGYTNYCETAAVTHEIGYGDYTVKAVGNKIVIFGYTPQALKKAVEHFITVCRENYSEAEKAITLTPEKIYITGTVNEIVNNLPVMLGDGLTSAYFDLGQRDEFDSSYEIVIGKTDLEGYSEYCNKLKAAGYETYLETYELGQNKFSGYKKDEYYVTVGFFNYDKYLRVTIEKNAHTEALKATPTEKITTSQISQLGLEYANNYLAGLSNLIRLEDGRFAVVDGGYDSPEHIAAFVKIIKDQAKEYTTEPVVAAWVITHVDGDHVTLLRNNFTKFKSEYGITVENVFFYKSPQDYMDLLSLSGGNPGAYNLHNFDSLMRSAKAVGTNIYKPVMGQVFYFSNMKIEVLSTPSSMYPHFYSGYDVVTRMTLTDSASGETTSIFNTGDAIEHTFQNFNNHFGEYMKSDICVFTHHSSHLERTGPFSIGKAEYYRGYKLINASILFSPDGWIRTYRKGWTSYSEDNPNYAAFYAPNFKECYVAGTLGGVTTVPLPYVPGNIVSTGNNKIEPDMSYKE